jgi:hypothetical protein
MHLQHNQIIHLYNSVLRGLINYYGFVHNYSELATYAYYILKQSCAKLLAAKFTLGTMRKTYNKFGNDLKYQDGKEAAFIKPSYKINTNRFNIKASPIIPSLYAKSLSLARLENKVCVTCGSEYRVEMHHVRMMKDLNPKISEFDKLMVRRNRKQIPLCRSCHMELHRAKTTAK